MNHPKMVTLSAETLQPGDHIGPYRVEKKLGAGGMGEVVVAFDSRLGRRVAIKRIRQDASADRAGVDRMRLRQEARAAAALNHPAIVRIYDILSYGADDAIVMEWIEGRSLAECIERGPLELSETLRLARQVAEGLSEAHRAGLVHRDLKAENVMVVAVSGEQPSRSKILDFGLAKTLRRSDGGRNLSEGDLDPTLTGKGMVIGTVRSMSPEQAQGLEIDPRSDLFSLGVLLYEMLTGRSPFRGVNAVETLRKVVTESPPPVRELRPAVPEELERLIVLLLDKDPDRRPESAGAVARALQSIAEGFTGNGSAAPGAGSATLGEAPTGRMGASEPSPYPGLAPFERQQAPFFFGRQREVDAVWTKLEQRSLLAIIGPSGAGKSSFLRAGVLAALPGDWGHAFLHPGSAPRQALGEALAPHLAGNPGALRQLVSFEQSGAALATVTAWREAHAEVLLILDQFEELFTLNDREQRARFAGLLGRLRSEAGVRVLLSMRDDFLFRCHDHPELADVFVDLTPLGPPSGAALRQVLVKPARRCEYEFEDEELVEEMLADVAGERGALPLLAFAAARLWELRDRRRRLLTREAYEEIGGVGGALAQHAETLLLGLGPEHVGLARDLFRHLLTPDGTRAARDVEDLLSLTEDREAMAQVMSRFVDGRLLTRFDVQDGGGQRVEIIHESLLSAWPRLVRWQTQDADNAQLRDQLRRSAKLWEERGRPEDLLWTGTSYLEYLAWRGRAVGSLTASEQGFAAAMVARANRKRQRKRLAVLSIFTLLVTFLITVAFFWQRAADQARRAEASELVARGQLELENHPTSALAHALASLELADQPAGRLLAVEALAEGPPSTDLGGAWITHLLFTPDGAWLIASCQDGRVLAWSQAGGDARLLARFERQPGIWIEGDVLASRMPGETLVRRWSLPDLEPLRDVQSTDRTDSVAGIAYTTSFVDESSQGAGSLKLLQAWPLAGGEPRSLGQVAWGKWVIVEGTASGGPRFVFLEGGEMFTLPVTTELQGSRRKIATWAGGVGYFYVLGQGSRVLTILEDGTRLGLWSLVDGPRAHNPAEPLLTIDLGAKLASNRGLHVRGDVVATYHQDTAEIRLWSLKDGQPVGPGRLAVGNDFSRFELSPDGSRLAYASIQDHLVYLIDLAAPADARAVRLRRGATVASNDVAFHPGKHLLATGDINGVALWSLGDGLTTTVEAHAAEARSVDFSPDGRSWVSASVSLQEDLKVRLGFLDGRPARRFFDKSAFRVAFAPPDQILVASLDVLLLRPGQSEPRELPGFNSPTMGLAIDAEGRRAAAGGGLRVPGDGVIRVWDLAGDTSWPDGVRILDSGDRVWVVDLAFLPDGALLSATSAGLQLWNVEDGTFERLLESDLEWRVLGTDQEGRILATVATDMETFDSEAIRVWDREHGVSWDVSSHGRHLHSLAVSPDGRSLITGDRKGVVRIGPVSGEPPHLLFGHEGLVWDVDVAPDGQLVASVGNEGDLRLWPMPEGRPLHTLPYAELLAKLRSSTNLRVVADDTDPSRYKLEAIPFRGWQAPP